jgi:hypothetical protein
MQPKSMRSPGLRVILLVVVIAAFSAASWPALAQPGPGGPQRDGRPDGALWVMVDRRAPLGALAALTSACADARVRIWKLPLAVERTGVEFGPMAYGMLSHFLPVDLHRSLEAFAAECPTATRLDARSAADAAQLAARVRAQAGEIYVLRAAPELRWEELEPVLDALAATRATLGAIVALE